MAGEIVRLHIGDFLFPAAVLTRDVHHDADDVDRAEVVVGLGSLVAHPVDFARPARLRLDSARGLRGGFAGYVESLTVEGQSARLGLASQTVDLVDLRFGGLTMRNLQPLEALWSLVRLAGIPERRIQIAGFAKPPPETFRVALALDGLRSARRLQIGNVFISSEPAAGDLVEGLQVDDLNQRYRQAQAWAWTHVQVATLPEAEEVGIRAIDRALSWAIVRSRFSTALLPQGQYMSFRRVHMFAKVRRRNVVLVRAQMSRRMWLRAAAFKDEVTVSLDEVYDFGRPHLVEETSDRMLEAVNFWRQAAESDDSLAVVVLLSNALEFFTAGIKPETSFSPSELQTLRRRAKDQRVADGMGEGLSPGQQRRLERAVDRMVEELNTSSFGVKLDAAIALYDVPMPPEDRQVLNRVRRVRNDLFHGRDAETPERDVLQHALAVVDRMLVYRVHREGESAELAD